MTFIEKQLLIFKQTIEEAIETGGVSGKNSIIRSSTLINLIHDAVKYELMQAGVNGDRIIPRFGSSKPELKLAGYLKQKDQDICVVPARISKRPTDIDWGPLAFLNLKDEYGFEFSTNTLVVNIRSQMSSVAKNTDTLFERTTSEADNLHRRYPEIVLGEVYMIPVYEYDDRLAQNGTVGFKSRHVALERYISFFNAVNGRKQGGSEYEYERCALLLVDFNSPKPRLYHNSAELKEDGLISDDFHIEYATLDFTTFTRDILKAYAERYDIDNLR